MKTLIGGGADVGCRSLAARLIPAELPEVLVCLVEWRVRAGLVVGMDPVVVVFRLERSMLN